MEQKEPRVAIETSLGTIELKLYAEKAPLTVENFMTYVKDGFYNGTVFHRVIKGFMIQGGGMNAELDQKPTRKPIKNEADNKVKNKRGTIAMARTSVVDSATAQFFINTVDNEFLNFKDHNPHEYGYCVFGEVVSGMDIVDKIEKAKTGSKGGHRDVPIEAISIVGAKVL